MPIASDLFRTITVKINDISQQLPYIVVNQADDNGKIIRFVPLDHGQKVTGFTGARLYYPPRSDNTYGDYVTGVESDGAWDFTIPVGALSAGRVGCNLAFIDGDGETYSRNVVFLVEPAVSGVYDPGDGQQTRLDKVIGTVQTAADTAIGNINQTVDDAMESIGKAEQSINESVTAARGSANAAANSEQQASASAGAAQTSERNAANSATQALQSATAAKQSETNAAESARNAAESERNAASSAEQAANIVASVSGSVTQAENAAQSASQSAASAAGSASVAGGSAQAAADSASKAGESATAAKVSETNAASSASAAKISETNADASATAAQQAVEGFGLEVGTTTTGDPGTDAAVEIQKNGTKYTANFTIPRGDKGEKGDTPSLSRTMADPESQGWNAIDFNDFTEDGVYTFNGEPTNSPRGDTTWITGTVIVSHSNQHIMQLCAYGPSFYNLGFALRNGSYDINSSSVTQWNQWRQIAFLDDLPNTTTLANDIASLSTRVQALEAHINSLGTNQ